MRSLRLIIGLACLAVPLAAQTSNYVVRLGRDTVALERVIRAGSKLTGDLFTTSPRGRRSHYVAILDGEGRVSRFEVTNTAAVETPPALSGSI